MKNVKIGILGIGTVGAGVYELLEKHKKVIGKKSGIDIEIKKIADKAAERRKLLNIPASIFTPDADDVISDPDIRIVVQLIGGTTVSRELMLKAISHKKNIVTANKALLAEHGVEIFKAVVKEEVEFGYEASVGGGIPIIKTIRESLVGNQIDKVIGIVNGTTNFILTKMMREDLSFDEALKIAQELGFAEADPYLDVSGWDACHKITILSSLAFNTPVDMSKVFVEGIEGIHMKDIQYADELGFVPKLLAIAERHDNGVLVRVHPSLVSKENPLAAVSWEDNAIMLYSDFLGKSMYYGKGAGAKPTASAVVGDITDIALKITSKTEYNKNRYSFYQDLQQKDFETSRTKFYFRFSALDRPGILSKIAGILGKNNISIASVIQKETEEEFEHVPLVILTHEALEADTRRAVKEIDGLSEVEGKSIKIRVIEG
ncbi:MAG TPA: homoserine dehydrogenase [Spirochaetes bacterium]|nr:homoserine dehydrogenase [Spirochaetota bacterium]